MVSENFKGHTAAIITNIIFGINVSVTKAVIMSWMTPFAYTMTRITISALIYWTLSLFMAKEKTDSRDRTIFIAGGILGLVITQVTFSIGMRYTSPVTWALISALNPIIVLLLSALFLKDPVSPKKIIGVIVGISGVVFMVLKNSRRGDTSANVWGIILAVVSAVSYASNFIIMKKTSLKYKPVTMMKWMFLWAAITMFPIGVWELPGQRLFSPEVSLTPILLLAYAILLSNVFGFFLMPVALKRIKATTASIYINLQPVSASVAAIAIGQDVFTWDKPLALALIIIGVLIVTQSGYTTKGRVFHEDRRPAG